MVANPPLNYLSYRPRGRYSLLAIWGWSARPEWTRNSSMACVFTILDTLTGAEVERFRPMRDCAQKAALTSFATK